MSSLAAIAITIGCDPGPIGSPAKPTENQAQGERALPDEAGERYAIDVEFPEEARPGREALAKIHVRGLGDWHLNTDFPVELRLRSSSEASLVMAVQTRDDAERLDDAILTFAVPFTALTTGPKHFEGRLSFAMCSDEACDPQEVPVGFTLEVQACDAAVPC